MEIHLDLIFFHMQVEVSICTLESLFLSWVFSVQYCPLKNTGLVSIQFVLEEAELKFTFC